MMTLNDIKEHLMWKIFPLSIKITCLFKKVPIMMLLLLKCSVTLLLITTSLIMSLNYM